VQTNHEYGQAYNVGQNTGKRGDQDECCNTVYVSAFMMFKTPSKSTTFDISKRFFNLQTHSLLCRDAV
jgi:hypothetical protein